MNWRDTFDSSTVLQFPVLRKPVHLTHPTPLSPPPPIRHVLTPTDSVPTHHCRRDTPRRSPHPDRYPSPVRLRLYLGPEAPRCLDETLTLGATGVPRANRVGSGRDLRTTNSYLHDVYLHRSGRPTPSPSPGAYVSSAVSPCTTRRVLPLDR